MRQNERIIHVYEEPAGISGFGMLMLFCLIAAMTFALYIALDGKIPSAETSSAGEVYDSAIDAWRYKDTSGQFVHDAEVYIGESDKWVRYDEHGYMIKGWYTNENGTYYYDMVTGAMLKGAYVIDGLPYYFDDVTGVLK